MGDRHSALAGVVDGMVVDGTVEAGMVGAGTVDTIN
jgi:hypothetical protein